MENKMSKFMKNLNELFMTDDDVKWIVCNDCIMYCATSDEKLLEILES